MSDVEPLISLTETAQRLGIPRQTLYDMRKHGRGPRGYRIGNKVQFRWSEVTDWLNQHKETA